MRVFAWQNCVETNLYAKGDEITLSCMSWYVYDEYVMLLCSHGLQAGCRVLLVCDG